MVVSNVHAIHEMPNREAPTRQRRAITWSTPGKEKWYMQNNPKTELHMHSDPQMRIGLQLFWWNVTINVFSTAISLGSPRNFLHIQIQSMRWLIYNWSFSTGNASNEEKKTNQDNCSWPSKAGILQSSKTKSAPSEELVHDTMDWFKSLQSNRYKTVFSKISFILLNLKIVRMQRKKKEFRIVLEISCFWEGINTLWANVGKK